MNIIFIQINIQICKKYVFIIGFIVDFGKHHSVHEGCYANNLYSNICCALSKSVYKTKGYVTSNIFDRHICEGKDPHQRKLVGVFN